MAFLYVTGVEQVDRRMKELKTNAAARASQKAVRAGANLIARKARLAAPVGKKKKDAKQRLKNTIRVRTVKDKKSVIGIKVTVAARHGHFVTLGVEPRQVNRVGRHALSGRRKARQDGSTDRFAIRGKLYRGKQLVDIAWKGPGPDPRSKRTGGQRANPFFRRTHTGLRVQVRAAMLKKLGFEMQREFQKGNRAA